MAAITLPADATTLVLNGTTITDFAEGDTITIAPVNPSTSQLNAIGGGVNINERSDKGVSDATIRVQKYSDSDKFLNNLNRQSPPVLVNGSSKTIYGVDGLNSEESYLLENGSITTQPTNTQNSTDGNAMMEYVVRFRNAARNL